MLRNAHAVARPAGFTKAVKSFVEQRSGHRVHTVCRFAKAVGGSDQGLWRICNISDRGMMLRSYRLMTLGEPLSIALSDDVTLEGVVAWSDGEHCGLRFNAPIDSGALLASLAKQQQAPGHRPLRLAVDGPALVFDETGVHSVRVRNLSQHGVGLSHLDHLRRGAIVKLVLANGSEHRGVVRWADQERAGLRLLEPFTPEEVASASRF